MDDKLEVSLFCGLCGERHEQKIPMPAGWDSPYRSVSDEHALCPKHRPVKAFIDSQCPGCVGGWGDCDLWRGFAYRKLELSAGDMRALQVGICPKRTNGTFSVSDGKVEQLDLRDGPAVEGGKSLLVAIQEYSAKYHGSSLESRSDG
jgi:hypothetical protein